jgi:3D (Asp-Asp-Asp) domain-containing protein
MPFTTYTRTVVATLVALTSLAASAQTGALKTQTVVLVVQGESHVLRTTATTVAELLAEQRVTLTETVQLSVPVSTPLTEGLQITVEPKSASATTKKSPPRTLVVAGKSRNSASSRSSLSSRSGLGNLARYEGKRTLTMTATGYGPGENGAWGNRTALGTRVRFGVVAVDPRVIKLGTRLYVEGYGECIAEDTGSAIKGLKIDLAFNSDRVANQYGRRRIRVVILD